MKPRFNGFARAITMSLSTFAAVVVLASPVAADWLAIKAAHPNGGVLVIDGHGFRKDVDVSVNEVDLKVLSVTATEIRAALPSLTPGTYRLASGETKWRASTSPLVAAAGRRVHRDLRARRVQWVRWGQPGQRALSGPREPPEPLGLRV